jgi:hypothetical protein
MVKPVDLQDNLSKTQLLEKIQQLQKSAPDEAQKHLIQELQKKAAEDKNRVSDLPKTDRITIQTEEEKKKKEQKKKKKKGQNGHKFSEENQKESPKNIDYLA